MAVCGIHGPNPKEHPLHLKLVGTNYRVLLYKCHSWVTANPVNSLCKSNRVTGNQVGNVKHVRDTTLNVRVTNGGEKGVGRISLGNVLGCLAATHFLVELHAFRSHIILEHNNVLCVE